MNTRQLIIDAVNATLEWSYETLTPIDGEEITETIMATLNSNELVITKRIYHDCPKREQRIAEAVCLKMQDKHCGKCEHKEK